MSTRLPSVTVVEPVMGTVVTVQVRGRATADADVRAQVDAAVAAVIARMRDDERVFSTYRPDSDVSLLRDGLRALDDVDPRVREVETLCRRLREIAEVRVHYGYRRMYVGCDGTPDGWAGDVAALR